MASEENTASAIDLGILWWSCSSVAMGRPTSTRLSTLIAGNHTAGPLGNRQPRQEGVRARRHRAVGARPGCGEEAPRLDYFPMHVIVVGCGRVGRELGVDLEAAGHSVAIIDKNRSAFRRLPDRWTGRAVVGYGFDRDVLEQAGISQAGA